LFESIKEIGAYENVQINRTIKLHKAPKNVQINRTLNLIDVGDSVTNDSQSLADPAINEGGDEG